MRWLAGLVWMGCAGAEDGGHDSAADAVCPDGPLEVVIGTGDLSFSPLSDGAEVAIVNGPQGGWHLWTGAQLTHVSETVSVVGAVSASDNGMVLADPVTSEETWIDLSVVPGTWSYEPTACSGQFYGVQSRLDDFEPHVGDTTLSVICGLNGRSLAFTVTVTDQATGETVSDTVQVVGRPDESTQQQCAAQH